MIDASQKKRMFDALRPYGGPGGVLRPFAVETGILQPSQKVSDWPENAVPLTEEALVELLDRVKAFKAARIASGASGGEAATTAVPPAESLKLSQPSGETPPPADLSGEIPSISASAAPDLRRGRSRRASDTDPARLPPHSPEAEQGVLGCIMLSPVECLSECLAVLKPGDECFYDLRCGEIFKVMVEMHDAGEAIDLITLQQRLKDKQLLEEVGGIAYLASLESAVPSASNLSYYLDIVREKALLRKMIHTCTEAVGRVYDYEGEVETLLDEVERDILRIGEARAATGIVQTPKTLVMKSINHIEALFSRGGKIGGISTGFPDLDRMTDGLHGGEMIVIAARPSQGKSSLMMNIAEHIVIRQEAPVGVFSLEMTAESLMTRTMCSCARVNLRKIRDGFMTAGDFPKLQQASRTLLPTKLYIDETPALTVMQLRARARRMWQQYGIGLFAVDYLQLMGESGRRDRNREREVADMSAGLKALAKELNVPVIVLCQLNRTPDKREKGAEPRLSDLRESGAIEQDADVVGLLYKPGKENDDMENQDAVPVNLKIEKQRNGPTGNVHLTFLKQYCRFESAAKVSDADVPRNNGGGCE